jgi:hypothetical protein
VKAAADAMRKLWEKFGPSMTRSAIHVDGVTREMKDEEKRLFDKAFGVFDQSFAQMNEVYDEARRENARRKSK